jgi:DNA polymerase I-like protein with 3'-5' exonuclease and polymerase domains
MSAAVEQSQTFDATLSDLRQLVHEAGTLGATFRLSGASVAMTFPESFPVQIQARLCEYRDSGWLGAYFGNERLEEPAITFATELGVVAKVVTTRAEVVDAIRQLRRDIETCGRHVGLDIETSPRSGQGEPPPVIRFRQDGAPRAHQPEWKNPAGLDPHRAVIASLQLYAGGDTAFIFRRDALARVLQLRWLRRQHLVAHNAGFELKFLLHHASRKAPRYPKQGRLECSMQAMGLLHGVSFGGSGRSLEKAAETILGLEVPKDLQASDWAADELSPGQIAYATSDAVLPWRMWPQMAGELKAKARWEPYELQRRVIPAVADMELRGMGFDRKAHAQQVRQWSLRLAKAGHAYKKLTKEAPPSGLNAKQDWLQKILAEHPEHSAAWPLTPTERLSTRAGHLKRLIDIDTVSAMLEISANEQLLSNFGTRLAKRISPVTGRLHGHFNISGGKTGRFTSSGPNLQQLPGRRAPEFKRCIIAAPGHKLVRCDWSQIELRAAAWMYHDSALTQIFADGRDIHKETAAFIAGIPISEVTEEQRNSAKPINFGAIYGQGPDGLREAAFVDYGVKLSLDDAVHARTRFFDMFHRLEMGLRDNWRRCADRGYIAIGCGRVVEKAWERDVGEQIIFTRCCNIPIQGICADALLRALTMMHTRLRHAGIRGGLVACIHDELLLEVVEEDAEAARELLERTMTDAFVKTFPGAPTTGVASASIGMNWAECKTPSPSAKGELRPEEQSGTGTHQPSTS